MEKAILRIEGMSCGHCVGHVTRTLETLEGVTPEDVEIGRAIVTYDPATVEASTIAKAVTDEGYPAQLVPVR
jgi:copper chaperone CopZ